MKRLLFFAQIHGTIISAWWFQPSWKIWKSMGRSIPCIPYILEHKTCSKPPTRYGIYTSWFMIFSIFDDSSHLSLLSWPFGILSFWAELLKQHLDCHAASTRGLPFYVPHFWDQPNQSVRAGSLFAHMQTNIWKQHGLSWNMIYKCSVPHLC